MAILLSVSIPFLFSCQASKDGIAPTNEVALPSVDDPGNPSPSTLQLTAQYSAITVANTSLLTASGGSSPYTYSIISGPATVNGSGLVTPTGATGTVVVRVTDSQGLYEETSLTITSALQISPAAVSLDVSTAQNFSASGGVAPFVYSIMSGGGSINSVTGQYVAPATTDTVQVRILDALGNSSIANVSVQSLPTISSLANQVLYEGRPQNISFSLTNSSGALTCTSTHLSATTSDATVIAVSGIVFSGSYPNCQAQLMSASAGMGTAQVTITVNNGFSSAQSQFQVTAHKINSVTLSPLTPIIPRQSNFSFTLMATYSDASTRNITSQSSWASSNGAISSFTSPGVLNNTYAGTTNVTTNISANYGSFSAHTTASINAGTVTNLIVDVTSATLNVGQTRVIKCYGITSDGGTIDLTESCSWSSTNSLVASVDNTLDKGLVTANSLGNGINITASYATFNASSTINVDTIPPVVSDNGLGLTARYYQGANFNTLVNTRIDSTVNFNWATGINPAGNNDIFSVRWTGFVRAPETGNITFYTNSDDGVRLYINGVLVINNWTDHAATENSAVVAMTAGQKYSITLEFYENGGFAVMQLRYSAAGTPKQIIPQINLFHQ